jgi:hypothetical protein
MLKKNLLSTAIATYLLSLLWLTCTKPCMAVRSESGSTQVSLKTGQLIPPGLLPNNHSKTALLFIADDPVSLEQARDLLDRLAMKEEQLNLMNVKVLAYVRNENIGFMPINSCIGKVVDRGGLHFKSCHCLENQNAFVLIDRVGVVKFACAGFPKAEALLSRLAIFPIQKAETEGRRAY